MYINPTNFYIPVLDKMSSGQTHNLKLSLLGANFISSLFG